MKKFIITTIAMLIISSLSAVYGSAERPKIDKDVAKRMFGIKMIGNETDILRTFEIESATEAGEVNSLYLSKYSDPTITARLEFSNSKYSDHLNKIYVSVRNKTNSPIFSNYYMDKLYLYTKNGAMFLCAEGDYNKYLKYGPINPQQSRLMLFKKPDNLKHEDVEHAILHLGITQEIKILMIPYTTIERVAQEKAKLAKKQAREEWKRKQREKKDKK